MALFLAKLGQDRLKKRLKKFRFEFCSYLNRARAFQKKKKLQNSAKIKKKKNHSCFISSQTKPRQVEKAMKKILFWVSFLPDLG